LQGQVLLNFRKSFETTHHIFRQFPLVHVPYFSLDEAKRKAEVFSGGRGGEGEGKTTQAALKETEHHLSAAKTDL